MHKYLAILKGKEGEFGAIENLNPDSNNILLPLVEVPPAPWDYVKDEQAKTNTDHLASVAARLQRAWNFDSLCEIPEALCGPEIANTLTTFFNTARPSAPAAIAPVVRLNSSLAYLHAIAGFVGNGIALRLTAADFDEDSDLESKISAMLQTVNCDASHVYLIVDLGSIENTPESALILAARGLLNSVPRRQWKSIALAASAFPQTLSDFDSDSTSQIERREWRVWSALSKRPERLGVANLVYGDYSIAHPEPLDVDPRIMRMSASVRYTTNDNWLILKGRNVRDFGYGQFHELCRTLVQRKDYYGPDFSWGDKYIAKCAAGEDGPGNATTWRKVGTNHHLQVVVSQLSS